MQTRSTIISTIPSIHWPAQWLIGCGEDNGWTPLQDAVEWIGLVVFVCFGLDWLALYLFRYRIGTVVSALLKGREALLQDSHCEVGSSPSPHWILRWLPCETEGMGEADCRFV